MDRTEVLSLDESTVDQAAALAIRYQLSHWDALIVAAALYPLNRLISWILRCRCRT
jgi:predicted nucleic acid-binding protein